MTRVYVPPRHANPTIEQTLVAFDRLWWAGPPDPDPAVFLAQHAGAVRAQVECELRGLSGRNKLLLSSLSRQLRAWVARGSPGSVAEFLAEQRTLPSQQHRLIQELSFTEFSRHYLSGSSGLDPRPFRTAFTDPEHSTRVSSAFLDLPTVHVWRFQVGVAELQTHPPELGRGGQASVYSSEDLLLRRPVAVKRATTQPQAESSAVAGRLRREAFLLAAMRHPNIPAVYGVGREDLRGPYSIAIDLLDGERLEDLIGKIHKSDLVRCCRSDELFVQAVRHLIAACQAAGFAHGADYEVVHRDIKPANIMVYTDPDRTGLAGDRTWLIDWGCACLAPSSPLRDRADQAAPVPAEPAGWVVGTRAYMSPEQARGEQVGPAADVYGLGACLYQLLTGRTPLDRLPRPVVEETVTKVLTDLGLAAPGPPMIDWSAFTAAGTDHLTAFVIRAKVRPAVNPHDLTIAAAEIRRRLAERTAAECLPPGIPDPPPPGGNKSHTIDSELAAICRRAMETDFARRYANAGQLAQALTNWVEDRPGDWPKTWDWIRFEPLRYLRRYWWLAAVVVFCIALGVVLWVNSERLAAERSLRLIEKQLLDEERSLRLKERQWLDEERYLRQRADELNDRAELTLLQLLGLANHLLPSDTSESKGKRFRDIIDQVDSYLRRANNTSTDDEIRRLAAQVARGINEFDQAITLINDGIDRASHHGDDVVGMRQLAELWHLKAALLDDAGRVPEAEDAFNRSGRIWTKLIEKAGRSSDQSAREYRRGLARMYGFRGDVRLARANLPGALADYVDALRLRRTNMLRALGRVEVPDSAPEEHLVREVGQLLRQDRDPGDEVRLQISEYAHSLNNLARINGAIDYTLGLTIQRALADARPVRKDREGERKTIGVHDRETARDNLALTLIDSGQRALVRGNSVAAAGLFVESVRVSAELADASYQEKFISKLIRARVGLANALRRSSMHNTRWQRILAEAREMILNQARVDLELANSRGLFVKQNADKLAKEIDAASRPLNP